MSMVTAKSKRFEAWDRNSEEFVSGKHIRRTKTEWNFFRFLFLEVSDVFLLLSLSSSVSFVVLVVVVFVVDVVFVVAFCRVQLLLLAPLSTREAWELPLVQAARIERKAKTKSTEILCVWPEMTF